MAIVWDMDRSAPFVAFKRSMSVRTREEEQHQTGEHVRAIAMVVVGVGHGAMTIVAARHTLGNERVRMTSSRTASCPSLSLG